MMSLFIYLGMIGTWQIVLIILVLLLLFGGKKIPDLMKGLGQGIKEFKNSMKGDEAK
ncbi:MAG: twin-arginine translocase TatA/TatE family subunit [Bacteroidia bacterium]|nr:twin-arginine translocase TatA/TatE family subunit [Bacteroidia bacterium]